MAGLLNLAESGKQFGTIYCDPRWNYAKKKKKGAATNHYKTMKVHEIAGIPVEALCARRSHLHLWTTTSFLREALWLIEKWGFEYRSMMIWCKPGLGLGNYWRVSHEILLLGVRGKLSFARHDKRSWRFLDRLRHSEKPDEIRSVIEQVSPPPRIELFGRKACRGWTVFGDQVTAHSCGESLQWLDRVDKGQ